MDDIDFHPDLQTCEREFIYFYFDHAANKWREVTRTCNIMRGHSGPHNWIEWSFIDHAAGKRPGDA